MTRENTIVKKDTTKNWDRAINFIPKENEIIIYTDSGVKIGNGKTKLKDLPFVAAAEAERYFYSIEGNTFIIETKGE